MNPELKQLYYMMLIHWDNDCSVEYCEKWWNNDDYRIKLTRLWDVNVVRLILRPVE